MAAERTPRGQRIVEQVRARKERHKQRGRLYRIVFGTVGALLIVLGLLLSAPGVPGPGLLLAVVGLGMLALEFDRAERLLERMALRLDRLSERASRWNGRQKALELALLALAVAAVMAAVLLWDVPFLPG